MTTRARFKSDAFEAIHSAARGSPSGLGCRKLRVYSGRSATWTVASWISGAGLMDESAPNGFDTVALGLGRRGPAGPPVHVARFMSLATYCRTREVVGTDAGAAKVPATTHSESVSGPDEDTTGATRR